MAQVLKEFENQSHFTSSAQAGCLVTPPVTMGTTTINRNSGPPSTAGITIVVTRPPAHPPTRPAGQTVATTVGTVTAGQFLGCTVNQTAVYPAPDVVQCAIGDGVTSSDGNTSLTLLRPL